MKACKRPLWRRGRVLSVTLFFHERTDVSAHRFILRVVQPGIQAFSLSGRRALVTGGSRGLGLAFARALGQAGADVAILARDPDANAGAVAALAADGIQAYAVAADLTLGAELEPALASVI